MTFEEVLARAASRSQVALPDRVLTGCAAHFALLLRWNRVHNLTRITDPEEAARTHYLDCLAPLVTEPAPPSFVDVGSGAGFPGLLAALVWPIAKATLVEPAAKRASFLRLAAGALGVDVEVTGAGTATGSRVLSRATFSPGSRAPLANYLSTSGTIAVWGHPHDASTWSAEVSTWPGAWNSWLHGYEIDGVEPRCLLLAERGESDMDR